MKTMNFGMRRAAVVGAAAGVSAVLLVAGAGPVQAEANPVTFTNQAGTLQVIYSGDGFSLFATVVDISNPPGATESCHYHAVGIMGTAPFPHDTSTWVTGPNPSPPMAIWVAQLHRNWSVTVTCSGTGNTASYAPVVY